MPDIIPLTTLDLPDLAPYRTMREQRAHRAERIFVAEGGKVVRRLLASPIEVLSVLVPAKWLEDYGRLLEAHGGDFPVYVAPKALLETLTGYPMYQGVLALGRIPAAPALAEVLAAAPAPRFFVALDGLANAENVGALVRNAAALGAQAFITGETCASPWLRRAVHTSMGALFRLPVIETSSLVDTLHALRAAGVACVGAHPHAEELLLPAVDLSGDVCLVLGSEGDGLRAEVRAACDRCAAVPMAAGVDSLNVVSAAAVFAYEVWRQRRPQR